MVSMLFVCATVLQFVVFGVAGEYFYGLNYGINSNQCPSLGEIKSDLTVIKQYSSRVRTFSISSCNEGQLALQAANDLGMHIYLGMWIESADTFNTEMAALQNLLASGLSLANVDAIIVGSEVLYRGDMSSTELANYIKQVGDAVRPKGVKVTTADVYYMFPPEVVEQLDFLVMNAFPYWQGVAVEQGADSLMQSYDIVVSKAQGKTVRISETGWPSAGDNYGASVPSPENQKLYLQNVLCVTRQRGIDMMYFSAIDEPYKGGVEAHWGIMDSNRQLKPSLSTSLFANPC